MDPTTNSELNILQRRIARLEDELAAARRVQTRLQSVLAQSSDFILSTDPEGRLLSLNRGTVNVSPQQLIGVTLADFCLPEQRALFQSTLETVVRTRQPAQIEVAGHDVDGCFRWWSTRMLPFAEGREVLMIAADITERKATEEVRRRNEVLLARTQQIAQIGGWELRIPEAQLFWTPETFHIHEVESDFEPTVETAISFYAPEAIPILRAAIDRALQHGTGFDLELRFFTARGNERWVRSVGEVEQLDGKVTKLFGTFQDITERKRAANERARLVTILENTTDIVSWCTPDLAVGYLNRAGRRALGMTDEDSLQGMFVRDIVPPDVWERMECEVMPAAGRTGIWKGELPGWGIDRERRMYSQVVLAHRDARGEVAFYSSIKRDITEIKAAEEERRQIDRKFEQTQRLERLGILAGGIAHDFNNLLTAILTNANLIATELSGNLTARGHLEQIERASQRAADLCQQLLAYSGRGQFVIEAIDVNRSLRDMLELLKLSISERTTLKLLPGEQMPLVLADLNRVRQIVMNLVLNAAEAIGDKGGQVTISTGVMRATRSWFTASHLSPELPEGSYVFLQVTDNGCGMTDDVKARLFDPFFSTKFTGRGLGLAAVLGIVRGHKGAIKIDSVPGRGTSVRVLLPPTQQRATKSIARPTPRTDSWRGSGLIMVVDDEEIVRKVVGKLLQGIGFEVILAADGNEALEKFHQQSDSLRLVLLDLTMPNLDGEQTFRMLHLLRPDLPVILMSGYSEQEATGRFAGQGLAGFLHKPFTRQQVIEQLRSVLA